MTSRPSVRALVLGWGIMMATAALPGCKKDPAGATAPDAAALSVTATAPADLLAEADLITPDAFWEKLLNGLDPSVRWFVPATISAALQNFVHLDAEVARAFDAHRRMRFVTVKGDSPENPRWAIAAYIRNQNGSKEALQAALSNAFVSSEEGGWTHYVAKNATGSLAEQISTHGDEIVLCRGKNAFHDLAAYARSTPVATEAAHAILHKELLAGPVNARLQQAWQKLRGGLDLADQREREKHAGKAPDFGDPQAILKAADVWLSSGSSVLADCSNVELVLKPTENDLQLDLQIRPGTGPSASWLSSMSTTKAKEILEAPAEAALTILMRSTPEARKENSVLFNEGLGKMGPFYSELMAGRGDELRINLLMGEPEGMVVSTVPTDATRLDHAITAMLSSKTGLFESMKDRYGYSGIAIAKSGNVSVATAVGKKPTSLAWGVVSKEFRFSISKDAKGTLEHETSRTIAADWSGEKPWANDDISFGLLFRKRSLDAAGANARALILWGRSGNEGRAHIQLDQRVVRQIVSMMTSGI